MILADDPRALAERVRDADWGPLRCRLMTPSDPGALARAGGGLRVIHDPLRLLRTLAIAAQPDPPSRHVVRSACGRYERDVWFAPARSAEPPALAVFLDGELYLHDMACLPAMRTVASCVFVSFRDFAARHADYTCDPRYARFIAEDVVSWARQRDDRIAGGDHLICGLSLSGLAAAHTALLHPRVFSSALCQSGSFWWLADHPIDLPATRARFWLSVGSEERQVGVTHPPTGLFQRVSQIEGVEAAARSLESRGAAVHHNLYAGGHDFAAWRDELAPAIRWLIGG